MLRSIGSPFIVEKGQIDEMFGTLADVLKAAA
jgi:hypothetical protein